MSRGYSLMELLVVVAVLAVAAALVAPAVGRAVQDVRARAEAGAVAAFLRSAREQAVTRQRTVDVTLERDAHALLLQDGGRESRPPTRRAFAALLRLEGSPGSPGVTFLPHGMSTGARFTVETPAGPTYVIAVDQLTGRVTAQRGAR